jgi:hypothetical protein
MPLGIGAHEPEQPFGLAARELPQIGRALAEAFDQCVDGRISGQQACDRLGRIRRQLGQPIGDARVRGFRIDELRRRRNAIGQCRAAARPRGGGAAGLRRGGGLMCRLLVRRLLARGALFRG